MEYRITDLYASVLNRPCPTARGISYMECDAGVALLGNKMPGSTLYYSYSIVLEGSLDVMLSDGNVSLKKNDLFIYPPGIQFKVKNVSADYRAMSILADELYTQDIPQIRRVIGASYIPLLTGRGRCTPLSDVELSGVKSRMGEIKRYIEADGKYRNECLQFEYALLVMDILDIQYRRGPEGPALSERSKSILVEFFRLLQLHVNKHHDIPFYADRLSITPIYLSRVVKKATGHTVIYFVSQMLGIEASNLLRHTDRPVAEIAAALNFADSSSFCKFFVRQMKMSPRRYRNLSNPDYI